MFGVSGPVKIFFLFLVAIIVAASGFAYTDWNSRQIGTLRVDAGPRTSETYFLMQELAKVLERHSEIVRLDVVSSSGQNDISTTASIEGFDLKTVQSHSAAIPNTALVADLYEELFQLITRADNGILEVSDLKHKKLALPPHGSAELQFFWSIGDHYDLFVQQVDWQSMDQFSAIDALLKNDVDAIFFLGSARHFATRKLIEEFEHTIGAPDLRMLEIDQAPAMGIKRPYIETFNIEKGTFDGSPPLPTDRIVTGAVRRSLVASTSADQRLIRELTRVLFENRTDLIVRFPLADRIKVPDIESGLKLPLHPGASDYFSRNEPSFIQENAEPLALLVTVIMMLSSALIALRTRFVAKQKNKADQYNYQALEIGLKIKGARTTVELNQYHNDMQELLKRAVVALDVDEVSDAGFQSFAFIWQTVADELEEKSRTVVQDGSAAKFEPQAAE